MVWIYVDMVWISGVDIWHWHMARAYGAGIWRGHMAWAYVFQSLTYINTKPSPKKLEVSDVSVLFI